MENPRTTSARDHDDHELIDNAVAEATPGQGSRSGHNIATDVATENELAEIADPEALTRPRKEHDIHNGQARPTGKPNDMTG